jgi:hypothetical protein
MGTSGGTQKDRPRRVALKAPTMELARARLAARTLPLRRPSGALIDKGRWMAAASRDVLAARARPGTRLSLRLLEAPAVEVTVLVERVSRGRSTVLTGRVVDASQAAYDLQYDLTRMFPSYFWEPVSSVLPDVA